MKRLALPLLLLVLLLGATPTLLGDTAISASITADTTWTAAGSPYILTGNIAIGGPAGVTLTINPGVTVKFATGSQLLVDYYDKGALVANGTSSDPIVFTSNVSATAGAWPGLRFGTIAGAPASSVSYATVEYAGSNFSGFGGITIHGGSPSFDHVTARVNQYAGIKIESGAPSITAGTIRDNGGYGIYLTGGGATLTDDTFTSNTSVAVSAPANTQLSGMTGLAATGNGTNGVEFRDGTIAANRTWKTCALPYIVTGNVYVQDASAPVLTIEAGNTVRFNNSGQITANYQNKGGIVAAGTSTAPILLTSNAASPAAGNWLGLYFGSYAGGPASSLSYTTIEYGGNGYNNRGGVTVYTQSPAFDHATIRNNAWGGVAVYGGSPSFIDTTFATNGGPGINVLNPATLTLARDTFTGNSGYAVTAAATTVFPDNSGLAASGNTGGNYLEIRAGTIGTSTTWPLSAIAYVVTGNLYVEGASSPILTIAAGNTIRFNNPGQIAVNNSAKGGLQAIGTAAAPILFTSNGTQSAGYWQGLWFGAAAAGPQSNVAYATIEYGGNGYYNRGGVTVTGLAPAFDHVTLRNNAVTGVMLNAGSAAITNSTITANGGSGINATGGTSLTLTNDALTNNAGPAVTLPVTVALTDASGLTASGNGTGKDAIEYRAGTIVASTTWPLASIPYVVTGNVMVEGSAAPVLTIAAGNTIRFNNPGQIAVNNGAKGGLQAVGTSTAPIVFTSNGALTAGFWQGLWFGAIAGGPQSNVAWATIEYGGNGYYNRGGLTVNGLAPVFDHVTLSNNAVAGLMITAGSPELRNSSATLNGSGVYATGGTTLTLNNDAFTNNSGLAVSLPVSIALADATGLSASGNGTGRDGIEIRGGTIIANTTWPYAAIPYIVTGNVMVEGAAAPILTIAAGNAIRFNNPGQIAVNNGAKGGLQAIGTTAAPILFTSNGTLAPGFWQGLWFGPVAAGPQSNVAYATIEYGGNGYYNRGGLTVNGLAPLFDHLTLRNNAVAGLVAVGPSSARITNSSFSLNGDGVRATSPATVSAALNYWNAAAGPCPSGGSCATGQQSVTTGVGYEPWLTASPSDPQFVASSILRNRTFSPAIGAHLSVDYTTALTGDATVTIRNSANGVVRTFTSTGITGSFSWDGTNGSGTLQPDGTYSYEIAATATAQPPASIARGLAVIDSNRGLTLTNPAVSPAFFSPNGDAVQETTSISAATNYDDAAWTVTILNAASAVVRTQSGSGMTIAFTWDGRDAGGAIQPDGVYTARVDLTEGTASSQKSAGTTLDNTPPALAIATPAANDVLSNVYTSGDANVTATGTVADANLQSWSMDYGAGSAPSVWTSVSNGTAPVSGPLGSWQTLNSNNGGYSLRLQAADKAGNTSLVVNPVTVGNFKVAQSAFQFNVSTGGTITYTSTVPFALTETLVVKNEAGATVRTIASSVARAAGSFNDVFNGRNDANALLPDGPYFYVANVTDGTHSMVWDLTTSFRNDYFSWNDNLGIQAYDPFNNNPMKFNYNFAQPARVTIATTTTPGSVIGNCASPTAVFFCPAINRWEESGPHTFTWSGIDHTGGYRTIRSVGVTTTTANFPKNAAVMFGVKPKVDNVKVTPPVFGPAVGTQTVEFDLTTYQSQPADITVSLVNLSTISTLRTIAAPAQAAGHRSITWDGRADNGMLLAPGYYDVIVTATDAQGNVVKNDILTTIKY